MKVREEKEEEGDRERGWGWGNKVSGATGGINTGSHGYITCISLKKKINLHSSGFMFSSRCW